MHLSFYVCIFIKLYMCVRMLVCACNKNEMLSKFALLVYLKSLENNSPHTHTYNCQGQIHIYVTLNKFKTGRKKEQEILLLLLQQQ